jgi:hypothetical protein
MKNLQITLLLGLAVSGCGNLSNEDLLFLAGLPRAEEVALEVEGGDTSGALTLGDQSEYYAGAHKAATEINAMVSAILDFVDGLGRGHSPTTRTDDSRVWGPIEGDGGITFRLEIRRSEGGGGGPKYTFCLHAGSGDGEDVDCDDATADGVHRILWGTYEPRALEAEARSGSGDIHIDFDASERAGTNVNRDRGRLDLDYDFSGGGNEKDIHLEFTILPAAGEVGRHATYDYANDGAGAVDFYLEYQNNAIGGGFGDLGSTALENIELVATWTEGGIGRGDATITGGDLGTTDFVRGTECWSGGLSVTYFKFEWTTHPEYNDEDGLLSSCP